MKSSNSSAKFSQADLNKLVDRWALRIVNFAILLVLFSTLFPFDFSVKDISSIKEIISRFKNSSDLSDRFVNVLLFLPLGFGLGGLLQTRKLGVIAKFAIVFIISAGLSFTVEVLQVFLPLRASTVSDIITNTSGGCLGFLGFHLWKYKIISYILVIREKTINSPKSLIAGFIGYIALLCLITIALPNTMNLKSWDPTFPLILGNERTGDRPWQGYISEIYIADRAISKEEVTQTFSKQRSFAGIGDSLLASYQLTGKGSYRDQTGHLPDLLWQGQPQKAESGKGVFLSSSHWLETALPASFMTKRIRETSQFTLNLTVATANTGQGGPARIVSLSSNPNHRNFTLGQSGTDLMFRFRTPLTGENGTDLLPIIVPDVFRDTNFHHLIITYDGLFLKIYVDKLENLHSFDVAPISYKILYYELLFIPLGFLVALVLTISRGQFIYYIFLFCSGVVLPSLIVEGLLASMSRRSISLENLLTSLFVTAGTLLIFTMQAPSWLNKKSVQHRAR